MTHLCVHHAQISSSVTSCLLSSKCNGDTPQITNAALLALENSTTSGLGVWEGGRQPQRFSKPSDVPHRSHVRSDFTRRKMRVIPPSRVTNESVPLR